MTIITRYKHSSLQQSVTLPYFVIYDSINTPYSTKVTNLIVTLKSLY